MIDAKRFAERYHAIWRDIAPTLELYVRRLNSTIEYERDLLPIESATDPQRRGLVNETAFELMPRSIEKGRGIDFDCYRKSDVVEAFEKARRRISLYENVDQDSISALTKEESSEVVLLASRTAKMVLNEHGSLSGASFRPEFVGCGYIDSSEGDLVIGKELVEVKAGDRPLRSIDVRQLITYLALDYASSQYNINGIRLCNPRRGVSIAKPVDELALQVSGTSASELFMKLIHSISSGEFSK